MPAPSPPLRCFVGNVSGTILIEMSIVIIKSTASTTCTDTEHTSRHVHGQTGRGQRRTRVQGDCAGGHDLCHASCNGYCVIYVDMQGDTQISHNECMDTGASNGLSRGGQPIAGGCRYRGGEIRRAHGGRDERGGSSKHASWQYYYEQSATEADVGQLQESQRRVGRCLFTSTPYATE